MPYRRGDARRALPQRAVHLAGRRLPWARTETGYPNSPAVRGRVLSGLLRLLAAVYVELAQGDIPESEQWRAIIDFFEPPAGQRVPYVAPLQAWMVLMRGKGLAADDARQEAQTMVAVMRQELFYHVKWITPYDFLESERPACIPVTALFDFDERSIRTVRPFWPGTKPSARLRRNLRGFWASRFITSPARIATLTMMPRTAGWCCTYKPDAPFVRSMLFASGASGIEALKAALIDPENYSQPFVMNRAYLRLEAQSCRFRYSPMGSVLCGIGCG